MGAYTSIVSSALSRRFCGGQPSPVRMLCSRSHSLMSITRTSWLIARSILRRFSACCSSTEENWMRVSFVTPSTSSGTSAPNFAFSASSATPVSSTTSCKSAAMMLSVSRPSSATRHATATGWLMYSSPDSRRWSPCACFAIS